jgi:putative holliday junction resolvase
MRVLAVDPGEKNIGVAISDLSGTIARPLVVLKHISRPLDAAAIADLARQHEVGKIVIGKSMDEEGAATTQSRRADHLAKAIHQQSELPVLFWDESFSTREARDSRITLGTSRKKRHGHLDDLAAAAILQSFLDANEK